MTSRIVEQGRGCDAGMGNGGSMNERLEMLKKARDRMIEDRDAHAKVLAAPFDRDKSERARSKFVETQMLIEALERAMNAEERPSAAP